MHLLNLNAANKRQNEQKNNANQLNLYFITILKRCIICQVTKYREWHGKWQKNRFNQIHFNSSTCKVLFVSTRIKLYLNNKPIRVSMRAWFRD